MKNLLIVLGFPLWFPLLLTAGILTVALSISLAFVVVCFWVAFVALIGLGIGGILGGLVVLFMQESLAGCALLGGALVCFGLAIFWTFLCKLLTNICILPYKWLFNMGNLG